jgi:hypothetical protein
LRDAEFGSVANEYEDWRNKIADKMLDDLRHLAKHDPDLCKEQMQDVSRTLVDGGLLQMGIKRSLPLPDFVDKMFRYNQKLDEATNLVPFRVLMSAESLWALAQRLSPPYNLM